MVKTKDTQAELKTSALRLLAGREHSRQELRIKLEAKAVEGDDVEAVLDRMVETDLQSDARFAESYVRSKGARLGSARLRRELIDRGVAVELIDAALAQSLDEDDLSRARQVWAQRFGELPTDHREWARQARFLQSRGFSTDVLRKVLKEPFDESA